MMRVKRLLVPITSTNPRCFLKGQEKLLPTIPLHNPYQWASTRFLDIHQLMKKDALEKERARLKDEMSRGYFADMSEMKKHGGKVRNDVFLGVTVLWQTDSCYPVFRPQIMTIFSSANKIIIPAMAAVKFPTIEVNYSDGSTRKLPVTSDGAGSNKSKPDIPKVSLLCLSFRASSGAMVSSWSSPFIDTFGHSGDVQLYEVSFVDQWLLCRSPIKKLLLKVMRKPMPGEQQALQRQVVYHFGDHYYFRKELRILNLLTGYIFLVDKLGRIRWQGLWIDNTR